MNYTIKRLAAGDFEEYMDFIDLVFSAARRPHDFRKLLPKLYQPDEEHMRCHYAVMIDGRMRAAVGSYPMTLNIVGRPFKVAGIGAVATHRQYEGKGLMRALMSAVLGEMAQEGVQLSLLGGLRQRYGHFGYEKCGMLYEAKISKKNVAHLLSGATECDLVEVKADDADYLRFIYDLYQAQPWYVQREPEALYDILKSWQCVPYVALQGGEPVGYLISSASRKYVTELFVIDDKPELYNGVLGSFVRGSDESDYSMRLNIPGWKPTYLREVSLYAEEVYLGHNCNWRVFDFANVAQALLQVKSSWTDLQSGRAVIGIDGYGSLTIEVSDSGAILCVKTSETADLSMDAMAAMRLLFGSLPPVVTYRGPKAALFSSWFPLPLCGMDADGV